MVLPSLDFSVYSDGSLKWQRITPALPPRWVGYRKPHDIEIVDFDNKDYTYPGSGQVRAVARVSGKPEVYRVGDFQTSLFPAWVRLWRELNPELDINHFSTLLDNHLAWTNNTGWPGRYNVFTGANRDEPNPAFHACIINGGAYLQGTEADGYLYVDTLRTFSPVPAAEEVLAKPWLWFWGTNITPVGRINYIVRLGMDGKLHPVRVPLVTSQPLKIPLKWLHRWESDALPDPLKVYV